MIITEKYFRAIGFTIVRGRSSNYYFWVDVKGLEADFNQDTICETEDGVLRLLPDITQSFPDFKREVLEKMEGEGYKPSIVEQNQTSRGSYSVFMWAGAPIIKPEIVKNNEILEAAVVAATRYFEGKK